ncbi:MAG: hypothetical protein WCC69_12320 [Pirellulales bacterium]
MSTGQGILRRFNDAGIAEFGRRMELLRDGGIAVIDDGFVTDGKLTEPIVPEVQLDRPAFKTKRDAGAYLSEKTRVARVVLGDDDRGLWTWLSAWHWDAICPVRETGRRKILAPYHYSYGHGNVHDKRKHLIATAVRVFECEPNCSILGQSPVYSLSKSVEVFVARLGLMRIRGLPALLDLLYWDRNQRRPKSGITDVGAPRPGDLYHRLPARIRQLEVTHDLTNLTAEQLLNLLGDEFRQWAVAPAEPSATSRQPRRQAASPPPVPPGAAQGTRS